MKIRDIENGFLVRLERGEDLIEQLTALANERDINGAFFHGLGGASLAEIGIYKLSVDKEYHYRVFEDDLEIISLNGNIARDESGEVMVHCHSTISGPDLAAYGGHVKRMVVAGTCEVFIDTRTGDLTRTLDEDIGLKLLDA